MNKKLNSVLKKTGLGLRLVLRIYRLSGTNLVLVNPYT
jgi:hypothetical protein